MATDAQQKLREEALADLEAGRLEAAVLKLGQLAALESNTARGEAAPPVAAPDTVSDDEAWQQMLERLRARAAAALASAPTEETASRARGVPWLIPLGGLLVLALVLAVVFGANPLLSVRDLDTSSALPPSVAPGPENSLPSPPTEPPTHPPVVPAPAEATSESDTPCVDAAGNPLPASSWLCRGHVTHGTPVAGPGASPETDRAGAAAALVVPPYQMLDSLRLGMPNRVRYEVNVVVPADYSREALVVVLADAARKTLRQRADARAVGIFAYSSATLVGRGWDRGRALVSIDGRGWTGDRTFAPVAPGLWDNGRILITLGTALAPGENIEVER